MEDKSEMVSSRLVIIHNFRSKNGLDEEMVKYLDKKTRKSTRKAYDNGWKHWELWCKSQQTTVDPLEYSPKNVVSFLTDNEKYSATHLNTLRSSIASVFNIIHEKEKPIAEHSLVKDFFAAKRRSVVKIPSQKQLATWDLNILITHLKSKFSNTTMLSLSQLQRKTILLLSIATMWRSRSDIGRIQHRDVILKSNKPTLSVIIHVRTPKESQTKSTSLGQLTDNLDLCPVTTLFEFINKTKTLRQKLPEDHTLFLGYLDTPQKPTSSVEATTVANWINEELRFAGIDTTQYQAHSIRSAASTKAVELGHSIKEVKKHANWSLNSDTFENFYYKPSAQESSSTAIMGSIFSSMENNITLEVGVEATRISLGATTNTNVAETKTENVIHAHPKQSWFDRIFG